MADVVDPPVAGTTVSTPSYRLYRQSVMGPEQQARPVLAAAAVVSQTQVGPDYWRLVLRAPEIADTARPGQFVMLTVARRSDAALLPRPMALFAWDRAEGTIEIVYRVVGEGTRALSSWEAGEVMTCVGPLGRGFRLGPDFRSVLLLGRGIGTCSLTALALEAVRRQIHVIAVASGRNIGAAIGPEHYRAFGVQDIIQVVDSDDSSDVDRLRARLDQRLLDGRKADAIYVCGSRRLLDLAAELGRRDGARVQVSLEAHMACGLGYCHGCSTGAPGLGEEAPLICKDGPVLDCVNVAAGTDQAW